jgi:DNA polymerase-3 subunit alpha
VSFVHLHSHSEYSMLDGASRIDEMFLRAKELGMPALGLTDHGVMYGAIPFYLAGKKHGIKPLVGMEAYIAPHGRFDRPAAREDAYFHLTMLAADEVGYRNLMKLSTLGYLEGYDSRSRRPRLDRELLSTHSEGIIVLSGCLSGELAKALQIGRNDDARRIASEYREIFGERYFLEVQNQGLGIQGAVNEQIFSIADELRIPAVATNDSHYTHKDDAGAHDILLCIQTGRELSETDRLRFDTDQFYLKSREEMLAAFDERPDAIENTLGVAEMCDLEIELHRMLLPHFEVPEGETLESFLRRLTEEGLRRRYNPLTPEARERASYELSVIENMGFSGYFLIVADFVQWAKQNDIRVGPGRGSVGGSIIAYALGITELDPIRWNLGFERFLNPGRRELPDIDIDFDERRRGEVIRYVCDRYGEDRVAQIITFSTIKAKQAIRDAARVLGLPYGVGDRLAKMYPPLVLGKEAPFEACFEKSVEWPEDSGRNDAFPNAGELRRAYDEDQVARDVIDSARKLEGLRRQHSIHAAGVVIGREPLVNHVPLQRTDAELVTQYEMNAVAAIGLLKIDFLGLRNLTVIEDTVAHIEGNRGSKLDIDSVALDDPKVFELLQRGSSTGIFQMESPGMTRLLKSLHPDRFEEIAALIALYRPGPMEEISRYVKGKHDPHSISYYHQLLEKVLADTNGVIVYQEQVTEILQVVAGFAPEEADMVRYAIGKKKSSVLATAKTKFEAGCRSSGLTDKEATGLWDLIRPFAGYSFNRAHANGYALIAYQTAWLKAHYPVEYMAALLTSVKDNKDKMPIYLAECRAMRVRVQPPDVNKSDLDFTPRGEEILFGLSAIRNVGELVAERIIEARQSGGPFTSFEDFLKRVDPSAHNKKVIESLAKAGAFDAIGVPRSSLLSHTEDGLAINEAAGRLVEAIVSERRSEDRGQFSLFAEEPETNGASRNGFGSHLAPGPELPRSQALSAEKEMLGFYVSEHPLADIEGALRYQSDVEIPELAEGPEGAVRTVGGILSKITQKYTKKGELMLVTSLEDMKGAVEVIFFPQTVQNAPPGLLAEDRIILVKGRIDLRDETPKLVASEVRTPDFSASSRPLRIRIPATSCTPDRIEELKLVLGNHPGPSPVLLHLLTHEKTTVLKLGGGYKVELRNGLFAEIKSLLGAKAVVD